ncbi:MAG: DsbA family protein, partial [Solirubrobacteraceae bacterium]|nr:DsbA family protein [Patulibacter sp.]
MALDVDQHEPSPLPRANIVFYYDFASPESYLALERLAKTIAAFAPELVPVRADELDPLPQPDPDARMAAIEAVAHADDSDVLPVVWPADFPDLRTDDAITVATYAKSIGKVAVFSLSLFRQIYAAGNDPADRSTLYLAAAASEIHPRAVDQALTRERVSADADTATEAARAAGVTSVPALRIG